MDLDGAIEKINEYVDEIEDGFGPASDRTESIATWLLLIEAAISRTKEEWIGSYGLGDYAVDVIDGLTMLSAIGICCLEQYTSIYEESCPWEHDFSYDDELTLEEVLMVLSDHFIDIRRNFYPSEDEMLRLCLEKVKEIVILCVSAIMMHGKVDDSSDTESESTDC